MKFFPLIWRNLLRRKFRTVFTLGCVFISFVLFAFLMIVRAAFTMGIDFAGADRLWMMHKVSIIQFMPVSYLQTIASTPGVALTTHATWFGGNYQDKPNQFMMAATEIDKYLKLYPELKLAPEQLQAAMADRQAAIIGKDTAERYGWKIGDRIPIQGTIWQSADNNMWYFNVAGIYDGAKEVDKTQFLFRYDYFDEMRQGAKGMVSWYVIKVDDPSTGASIAAKLDGNFANSPAPTKTAPEKAVIADFAKQTGNIGAMITAILVVVFFTILLVVGNVMAQSVRERASELAVLKTLGFSDGSVLGFVLAEAAAMCALGGLLGLGIATLLGALIEKGSGGQFQLSVGGYVWMIGLLAIVLMSIAVGLLPALRAQRLKIVDALAGR